jgi:tRNA-dihydrouridine synthase B
MLRLGPVAVDPPLLLAPMAGVTDRDFRLMVRRIGGVGLVAMEFVSSTMLLQGDRRLADVVVFSDEERPLAIQVYGAEPSAMAAAATIVEALGADVVDINMGCPANKVLRGCAGAALMADLGLARAIVRKVVRAVALPVTVKFRLGLDDRRRNHLELGRICEGEGAAAVAVHGRTARQMFTGRADWGEIARLKEALAIPVIGNGDVATADDAVALLRQTGCDGVMIGRGATRNPWIFRQVAARLSGGRLPDPTLEDRRRLILDHFTAVIEREPEVRALHKLRSFTNRYSRGLPQGHLLRRQIQHHATPADFLAAVERHCAAVAELERAA